MITENYIKMCEMATEIQSSGWEKNKENKYIKNTKGIRSLTYLPTLEQLFEIWCFLCNTNNAVHPNHLAGDHLPTHFIHRIHDELKSKNWFDKELCLKIIMKDFYHKTWTGEKWIIKKKGE